MYLNRDRDLLLGTARRFNLAPRPIETMAATVLQQRYGFRGYGKPLVERAALVASTWEKAM